MRGNSIRSVIKTPGFKITQINKKEGQLDVFVEPYKGLKAICSGCGNVHPAGFHGTYESLAEDVRLGEQRVLLHIKRRRYRCPVDERIYVEKIDWIEKGSRVTKAFSKQVNRLTAITTNQEAGWYLDLDDEKVYRMDKANLERQFAEKLSPPPAIINGSVDEVSYLKYHRYLTNVIDVDLKKVIWNAKGRKKVVLNQYYQGIGKENCEAIETMALDGARTFISSTRQYATKALIVYDRFHATQKVNKAIDAVRKTELKAAHKREDKELVELINCKQRFILLKRNSRLTEKQTGTLEKLCEMNEPIYKALLLKDQFLAVYQCANVAEAKEHLGDWFDAAFESGIAIFFTLAKKILDKVQLILNWFEKRISSAISEGINNKIKRLKRMAYGYRDITYFRLKIHQHCGLLNPRDAI